MKKKSKIIALILVAAIIAAAASIPIYMKIIDQRSIKNMQTLSIQKYKADTSTDKIHFLSTGSSDAILLESDGHFALIDAGEDTDNPRGFADLELTGYEQRVLDYLKANASYNGVVHLDFVLGTHAHSDHIGGFDTIINDDDITIDKAYLKVYDSSKIRQMEIDKWDNQEVYDQMVNALNAKGIPIVKPESTPFSLGSFTVTLFNTDDAKSDDRLGENDQSLGVLIEKDGSRIFLAGDIDNNSGDEDMLAPQIGKINILKVGHHSYSGSTTKGWLETLMPDTCIVTNNPESADKRTLRRITNITNAPILITGEQNGVIVQIGANGEISYFNEIH